MRSTWSVALVAGLALLGLAGCGGTGDAGSTSSAPSTGPSLSPSDGSPTPSGEPTPTGSATSTPTRGPTAGATSLTIELTESPTGPSTSTTLTCEPAGGTHRDPAAACAAITAAGGAAAFEPVPRDLACTEIWGGPQTASVLGTVAGQPVRADFSRINGCEIARWDRLALVLGSTGGA